MNLNISDIYKIYPRSNFVLLLACIVYWGLHLLPFKHVLFQNDLKFLPLFYVASKSCLKGCFTQTWIFIYSHFMKEQMKNIGVQTTWNLINIHCTDWIFFFFLIFFSFVFHRRIRHKTSWQWVNDDRIYIFFFWVNYSLKCHLFFFLPSFLCHCKIS